MPGTTLPQERGEPEGGEEDAERPLGQRRRGRGEPEPRPAATRLPRLEREQRRDGDGEREETVPAGGRDLVRADVGEEVCEATEAPRADAEAGASRRRDEPGNPECGERAREVEGQSG